MLTFAVGPNCTCSYCILHHFILAVKIMQAILFKNVLYEEVKILSLLNTVEYLSFYRLCGKNRKHRKHFLSIPKDDGCLKGKHLWNCFSC